MNKNLIKRFNFHSTMILKSTLGADLNNDTSATNRLEPDDEDENISKKVLRIKTVVSLDMFGCFSLNQMMILKI
jgi:hypothetical protein